MFNAATHIAQFWDGRAADVESQAVVPIMNPLEMDMPNEQAVVDALAGVPRYAEMFHQAFPDDDHPISLKNVGEALGAFERGLVTTSRWDKFIAGDHQALTPRERQGLGLFVQRGCLTCHTGPQAGGMTFQKVGTIFPWPNQKDQGRAEITHYPPDRMVFKVPSMKNIAETAPYFHDGFDDEPGDGHPIDGPSPTWHRDAQGRSGCDRCLDALDDGGAGSGLHRGSPSAAGVRPRLGLEVACSNPETFHLHVQRLEVRPQAAGGLAFVALRHPQRFADRLMFRFPSRSIGDLLERLAGQCRRDRWGRGWTSPRHLWIVARSRSKSFDSRTA